VSAAAFGSHGVEGHGTSAVKLGREPFLSRLLAQEGRADVQRAIAELLAGRPVVLTEPGCAAVLAFPVDGLTAGMLAELRSLAPRGLQLVVSGTRAAALAHLSRTVCRRAERAMVRLNAAEPVSDAARRYINRLSDLLFIFGRVLNRAGGRGDVLWQKGKTAA